MVTEQFYLKSNSFQENIAKSYRNLRTDTHFCDVTLACDDDEQIEAHRVILAACSQLFSNILKRNPQPHPIIYMKGLKAKDLVAIVDFIYNGEAKIYQTDLESFLALAQEIRIEGLSRKKGYFIVEKGKETHLPVKDISKTGSDLCEDGIDSVATNLQKPHSEDKEFKSQSKKL